jgi:type II secretory pathway component PulJ
LSGMILRHRFIRSQTGFTVIEMIIGIALTGILGGGIITAIYQINRINDASKARVIAVQQVENALYYINRDFQMAQNVQINGEDYWIRLTWKEWEQNNTNEADYVLEDGVLTRSYYVNSQLESAKPVASNISASGAIPPDTEALPPEKTWTIDITATTQSGHREVVEIRQAKIVPRPGS